MERLTPESQKACLDEKMDVTWSPHAVESARPDNVSATAWKKWIQTIRALDSTYMNMYSDFFAEMMALEKIHRESEPVGLKEWEYKMDFMLNLEMVTATEMAISFQTTMVGQFYAIVCLRRLSVKTWIVEKRMASGALSTKATTNPEVSTTQPPSL